MPADRYVVLGLAPARAEWFRDVSKWATSGSLPGEFVKCVSAEELRARLQSGRLFSAVIADASLPALDRDVLAAARRAGCPVLVVADPRVERDWRSLGAAALLPRGFSRTALLDALAAHAPAVRTTDVAPLLEEPAQTRGWRGSLVAVTGPGGTGASTAAIGVAQGLAADARRRGMVLLADLKLRAEQAMLHDAGDVVPGLQELVEAHRAGRLSPEKVRAMTFAVGERGYDLLLGLRAARHWSTVRPRALALALDGLRASYRVVVADVDHDVEGEAEGGSADVEERNAMARHVTATADVVLVVGDPSMKGLHSLARTVGDLLTAAVPPARVLTVLNRAPRSPRARAMLASALATLVGPAAGAGLPGPIFLPERRVEDCLRDGNRLPSAITSPLAGAVAALLERPRVEVEEPGDRVVPGSLATWTGA